MTKVGYVRGLIVLAPSRQGGSTPEKTMISNPTWKSVETRVVEMSQDHPRELFLLISPQNDPESGRYMRIVGGAGRLFHVRVVARDEDSAFTVPGTGSGGFENREQVLELNDPALRVYSEDTEWIEFYHSGGWSEFHVSECATLKTVLKAAEAFFEGGICDEDLDWKTA